MGESEHDLDEAIDAFQEALDGFFRGDTAATKALCSHREDVTLGNPFGPFAIGWRQVEDTIDRAGLHYRDGRATGFELVAKNRSQDLAYTVWVERFESRVGARQELVSGALRRTTVFRREDGGWKVVHTQADPITTPRAAESIVDP